MDVAALERGLRTYRPAGYKTLPAEFVWPRYEGWSVGNLPATIAGLLGVELTGMLPPLDPAALAGMVEGVRRVVLVVVDALGWEQLSRAMQRHPDLPFHRLSAQGRLFPITTLFPSTTNNVLSSLWTGAPPIRHGLVAFMLYLREWAMAVEAIRFSPSVHLWSSELLQWGFDPELFLPLPALAQWLGGQEVVTTIVTRDEFIRTPLSRMHFRGAQTIRGYVTASDFWLWLRWELQNGPAGRSFISGYWGALDTLAHNFGPEDESGEAEIRALGLLMEEIFLRGLTAIERKGTLFLLTADHGQCSAPVQAMIRMDQHPELMNALLLPPLGESRVPFFYPLPGKSAWVRGYLEERFGKMFAFMSQDELISSGLLGQGEAHPEIAVRLGELIGLARGEAAVVRDGADALRLRGRHGSLTPAEMLVPLLAMRLDY